MAIRYLTITMEQADIDDFKLMVNLFKIEVVVYKTGCFEFNPKMLYQEWQLKGDLQEINKFLSTMNADKGIQNSRIK